MGTTTKKKTHLYRAAVHTATRDGGAVWVHWAFCGDKEESKDVTPARMTGALLQVTCRACLAKYAKRDLRPKEEKGK